MNKLDNILSGIIAVAIIAVLVGTRSKTSEVIASIGKSFSGILGVVVSPVTDNGAASAAAAATTGGTATGGLMNASASGGGSDPIGGLVQTALSGARDGGGLNIGNASDIVSSVGGILGLA